MRKIYRQKKNSSMTLSRRWVKLKSPCDITSIPIKTSIGIFFDTNTFISFRQNNSVSSQVAIDDSKVALGLEARQFVYRLASKDVEYGIVPWVKDTELQKILKKYKKPHRTLFDDLEKLNHRYGIKKHKELIEVGTHFKTEQEILEENIKKINNYVPYDQNNKILIENRGRRKIKWLPIEIEK